MVDRGARLAIFASIESAHSQRVDVATKTDKNKNGKTSTKKAEPAAKSLAPKKSKRKASDEEEEPTAATEGEGDEDEEEDEDLGPRRPAGKPVVEPAPMVQARRLTPEAKAAINQMVQKGVPLGEAMRRAASWETFIAPAREDQTKAAPGGTRFESGGRSASVGGGEDDEFGGGGGSFEVDDDAPATASDDD